MAEENRPADVDAVSATDPPAREDAPIAGDAPQDAAPAKTVATEEQAAAGAAGEAPPSEAVVADADAPVGSPEAVEPSAAEHPAAEQPPAPEQPPAAAEPAPEQPPAAQEPAPEQPPAAAEPAPEQPPAAAEPAAQTTVEAPAPEAAPAQPEAGRPEGGRRRGAGQGKPRRDRQRRRRDRGPAQPHGRFTGPLPFQELRDAATSIVGQFGTRQALRDAFAALGDKERRDLSRLVADDGDWRVRARNIAAGSLGAGRVGKALAAQQISMARVEDLWNLTLPKEEADQRLSRVRNARRRDERRAQRESDRERRTDRVSRADLQKAQDGRVGAQIRIVIEGQRDDRNRDKDREAEGDQPKETGGSDLLDRLGY